MVDSEYRNKMIYPVMYNKTFSKKSKILRDKKSKKDYKFCDHYKEVVKNGQL